MFGIFSLQRGMFIVQSTSFDFRYATEIHFFPEFKLAFALIQF